MSEKNIQVTYMRVKNSYSEFHLIPDGLFRVMNYLFCIAQVDFFFYLYEIVVQFYVFL